VSDRRLAEAPAQKKPQRRGRFWLALIAMIAICAFAVYRSALFRLDAVQVTGAKRLSTPQIMEIAGLTRGMPRWEHPAATIEARLRQEPWIRSAHVQWQGNQVKIDIAERVPVGLLRYGDLFYLALDESGLILEQVDLKSAPGLPVIADVKVTKAVRGQQLNHQGLNDALTVLATMAEPMRAQVSEVQVEADRSLTLFMAAGATVQFGLVPDLERDRQSSVTQKVGLLGRYWNAAPRKQMTGCKIDLRVDGTVISSSGCPKA
jgi:cell division septal protein FtsQ